MSTLALFCSVDAFWQRCVPQWERDLQAGILHPTSACERTVPAPRGRWLGSRCHARDGLDPVLVVHVPPHAVIPPAAANEHEQEQSETEAQPR
jgi:hypothetical protein